MRSVATSQIAIPNPTVAAPVQDHASVDEIVLARTDQEQWLTWRPHVHPHLFIGGHSGTGGTTALRAAVMGWTAAGGAAFLIDPTHRGMESLREWPNVQAVAGRGDVHEAIAIVHALHAEMERRYATSSRRQQHEWDSVLLAIDEFPDLRGWCQYAWAYDEDDDSRRRTLDLLATDRVQSRNRYRVRSQPHGHGRATPDAPQVPTPRATTALQVVPSPTLAALEQLLRGGHRVGIHLAVRAAHCTPEFVGPLDCFTQRIWIGKAQLDESQELWRSIIASELSPRLHGRAVCSDFHGVPLKAQVVWTPDPASAEPEEREILRRMRPSSPQHESLLITAPEPDTRCFGFAQWTRPQMYRSVADAHVAHLSDQRPWILPRRMHPQTATVQGGSRHDLDSSRRSSTSSEVKA